jgi:hypothetical protein
MGALLTALVLLLVPAAAGAALPVKGADLQAHDHETKGRNWHVQMLVSTRDPRVVDTIVLFAEVCRTTILRTAFPIDETGLIAAGGRIKGGGTWRVDAAFVAPSAALGTARIVKGSCDSGPIHFAALTDEGSQHVHGPLYPTFTGASLYELRQAQALRRRAWQAADELFGTYEDALRRGFHPNPDLLQVPQVFHVRNAANNNDGLIFNSRRPEALVYWWREDGQHILLGFMFRVRPGDRPAYAGPIPIYHQHWGKGVSDPMTHVWLTNDLRTAWANCVPIGDLQAEHPGFSYVARPLLPLGPGGPCPG